MRLRRATVLGGIAATLACSGLPGPAPKPTNAALGGELARVGDQAIGSELVGEVARARSVSPHAALAVLVEDALIAQGARAELLDRAPEVAWATTSSLARIAARRLLDEANAKGLPSDDELARVHVVHAVVLRSHSTPEARARFVAQAVADAVSRATSTEDFRARARAAAGDVRTSIEDLPPFDASGRTDDGTQFDLDFVAGAFALHSPGETSPIVETPFGWHVIRLVERTPPGETSTSGGTLSRERWSSCGPAPASLQCSRVTESGRASKSPAVRTN